MISKHLYTQLTSNTSMRTKIEELIKNYKEEIEYVKNLKDRCSKDIYNMEFRRAETLKRVVKDLEESLEIKPLSVQTVLEELEKTDEEFSFEEIVYKIQEMGYEGDARTLADRVMESGELEYVRENILGEAMYLHNKVYQREYA